MTDEKRLFDDPGVLALLAAARRGDPVEVRRMRHEGIDIEARGELGVTPVLWSIINRDIIALRSLLDAGANPNGKDDEGHPPLQWAVRFDDASFLRTLLEHGADPNAKTHLGEPVMFVAIDQDAPWYIDALLSAGADLNATNRQRETALHRLAMANQFEQVARLIERGADYTKADATGATVALYVQENRIAPGSVNALWRDRVREILIKRGVQFPVLRH